MKIVVFSSNNKFANVSLEKLFNKRKDQIFALVIVTQLKGSIFSQLKQTIRYWKKTSKLFILYKMFEAIGGKKIIKLATKYNIPVIRTNNINDASLVEKLKRINPDISLCFVQQILKKPIIDVARLGTLNAHASLLPEYKGSAQYFWYLYYGKGRGGVTVHYIEETLDTGDIISKKEFPISKNGTMFEIHKEIYRVAGELFDEVIDEIENGTAERVPQEKTHMEYLKLPTSKDMKEFRKKGLRIFFSKRDKFNEND